MSLYLYINIPQKEPFYNNAQVLKKIFVGKSLEVLRNKLLKTRDTSAKKTEELKYIEEKLHNVFGKKYEVRFKNNNLSDDEYIRITAKEENSKELCMEVGFCKFWKYFLH